MRLETEIVIVKYKDSIFKVAFNILKNVQDAEDVTQDVIIKYHQSNKDFTSEEHIKSWLIRLTINKSKNIISSFIKRRVFPIEDYMEVFRIEKSENRDLFKEVMKLNYKYRIVIHLYYYEDYSIKEISKILKISENNTKVRLNRARNILKKNLKGVWINE